MRDVVIVGLGAMGSATSWQLARRGVDVLGIDAHRPPHAFGSSHGHSRVFRTAYFEHPAYVPLLQRARALWTELERESGRRLFRETGCLTIGPPHHELIEGVRESVRQHALPHEELDPAGIRRCGIVPNPDDVAVYEKDAGLIEPEPSIEAMLAGRTIETVRVTRIEPEDDHVVVHAGRAIRARRVVVALNAWLGRGIVDYDAPLEVMRQAQHWFRPSKPIDSLPCFIHVAGERAVYGLPPHASRGVKVCRHYGGQLVDPDAVDRAPRAADERDVREWMRVHLPSANGALEDVAVCMYGLTPDRHFVVGPHPEHPQIILAGGFSGHGFKMAPAIGEVLAQLATEGATEHDIALFDPARFTPLRAPR